jgi:hypothetical protein
MTFCVQVQVVPLLVEVPLQSWVHFILEVMVEAIEKIHCDGIEVCLIVMWIFVHLARSM